MLFADIAKTANVDQDHITRLLRHAMTNRIFYEPRAGYVAHTAASRELATDQGLQDWIGTVIEEWHPASEKVCYIHKASLYGKGEQFLGCPSYGEMARKSRAG